MIIWHYFVLIDIYLMAAIVGAFIPGAQIFTSFMDLATSGAQTTAYGTIFRNILNYIGL